MKPNSKLASFELADVDFKSKAQNIVPKLLRENVKPKKPQRNIKQRIRYYLQVHWHLAMFHNHPNLFKDFPFKNCNDDIIVCVRGETEIRFLNRLDDILSFINLEKIMFV